MIRERQETEMRSFSIVMSLRLDEPSLRRLLVSYLFKNAQCLLFTSPASMTRSGERSTTAKEGLK